MTGSVPTGGPEADRPVTRRGLLTGGALAAGGALAGAAAVAATGAVTRPAADPVRPVDTVTTDVGTAVEPFHGERQSGVATEPQAHGAFVALAVKPGTDRAALGRMLRLLSDDVARLTADRPSLADTEPELGVLPARLTVTFGFGPGLYAAAGLASPVAALPAFGIDALQPRWTGGDLLLQICSDDPLTVAHTQRVLVKDSRPFATVHWVQQGFRRAAGAEPGRTQRNLFGQLDGTANSADGTADSGLIFASYQADITTQYLPIQQRMAERDILNEWTTPIGSAVFAIPPGCLEGGWIGQQLLG